MSAVSRSPSPQDYRDEGRELNVGSAAWAHYRWPRIGFSTGFGAGLVLAFLFNREWYYWLVLPFGLGALSLLAAYVAACIAHPMK